MIKTNIKMRVTPEQLSKISDITNRIFLDYRWNYLNIKENQVIELYTNDQSFNSCDFEEIDADLFINTNGTCEETYLTKYTSQPKDLESALKKIENLHIALNKKRDKNKNQALEITKLLEQKKDLQKQRASESKGYCDLKKQIDDLQEENSNLEKTIDNINLNISNIIGYRIDERCEKTSYLKEIEKKFENTNNELARICELNKYLKEAYEIKLQEKNTIISYLESKLK